MQIFHVAVFLQNLNSLTRVPYTWEQTCFVFKWHINCLVLNGYFYVFDIKMYILIFIKM